jgi:hypothetical protein
MRDPVLVTCGTRGRIRKEKTAMAIASKMYAAVAIKWAARVTAILLFGMVLAFAIGEGPPNPFHMTARENAQTAAFFLVWGGLLVGCFRDGLGGALVLGGLLAFYLINLAISGRLPGGAFPLFAVPGVLFTAGFMLRRLGARGSPARST